MEEVYQNIMSHSPWKTAHASTNDDDQVAISQDLVALINLLLERDARSRPTAEQAMVHPWMRATGTAHHLKDAQSDLRNFNAGRSFRTSVRSIMALNGFMRVESNRSK